MARPASVPWLAKMPNTWLTLSRSISGNRDKMNGDSKAGSASGLDGRVGRDQPQLVDRMEDIFGADFGQYDLGRHQIIIGESLAQAHRTIEARVEL